VESDELSARLEGKHGGGVFTFRSWSCPPRRVIRSRWTCSKCQRADAASIRHGLQRRKTKRESSEPYLESASKRKRQKKQLLLPLAWNILAEIPNDLWRSRCCSHSELSHGIIPSTVYYGGSQSFLPCDPIIGSANPRDPDLLYFPHTLFQPHRRHLSVISPSRGVLIVNPLNLTFVFLKILTFLKP